MDDSNRKAWHKMWGQFVVCVPVVLSVYIKLLDVFVFIVINILELLPEISEHNPRGTIQKIKLLNRNFLNSALGLCSEISSSKHGLIFVHMKSDGIEELNIFGFHGSRFCYSHCSAWPFFYTDICKEGNLSGSA